MQQVPASQEAIKPTAGRVDATVEWRAPLALVTMLGLVFETVTGLWIYFAPFSVFNQFGVLLHTAVGIIWIPLFAWYVVRHWWLRFRGKFNHIQLLGYASFLTVTVCVVSGVVLTVQAFFGRRIDYTWDLVHVISGLVLIFAVVFHLVVVWVLKPNRPDLAAPLTAARRVFIRTSLGATAALLIVQAILAASYTDIDMNDALPESYSWKYGEDRPFAPSLARRDMSDVEDALRTNIARALGDVPAASRVADLRADPIQHVGIVAVAEKLCDSLDLTEAQRRDIDSAIAEARAAFKQRGGIDARRLAGSKGCGSAGCHEQILEEWLPSAHRYASMDFVFQEVQKLMVEDLAPEATRYCAGCHDPIALFSGAKNVGNLTLSVEGADEGISCLVCHSMVQTDVRGNADYTVSPPQRYVFEDRAGPIAKTISDFLIRAYPAHHIKAYTRPLYKTAEVCGACHKQFIDEELNDFGWVQGQNQYDSWRKSRWHTEGNPAETIGCRECHMPLIHQSTDPASGDKDDFNRQPDDGKHRSHRFLAANQFVPRVLELEGADRQCDLTVQWLRGEYPIPEIADRWSAGPVIRLDLHVPDSVRPGDEVRIQASMVNNKTGHDFPTGPLDMIEGWLELTVTDEAGRIVYASARPDERGYLVDPTVVFKAEGINAAGELIGRHELWTMVGVRYKRAMFPGFTDTAAFVFECPAMSSDPGKRAALEPRLADAFPLPADFSGDELRVSAVLWYCKFSAPFLDRLFGEDAHMRSEVTDIARAEAVIRVSHHELAATQ